MSERMKMKTDTMLSHCRRREGAHEEKPTGKIFLMAAEEI